ncbi:hypothetical protein JSR06_00765 [Candidatus Vidania fulgoroideae]|uniref:RNA-binding S4 domain-containing protein n=1 Tax=Candidatus Vidania fulgoroideorum TaxID=881286 RepID=A0A975AEP5_9PROT|nr:hypothetical protein JSR06_00765 [Candidatus Vidania fulgoroideae]
MKAIGENLELFSNNSKFSLKSINSSKFSYYKRELIEKKKIKIRYNINNRAFNRLVINYNKVLDLDYLVMILETRIDNAIYRSGIVKTRKQSRQLIVHGHVKVNDNKISKPSFNIKVNDLIKININSSFILSNKYFIVLGGFIKIISVEFYKNYKSYFNFFNLSRLLNN